MTQVATERKPTIGRRALARLTGRKLGDTTPRVGYRSLFGNRDYRLLFSGLTISMSGSWAYNVALVVFVFNATHSPAWVAAASMTRFLTALVTSPIGGLIADRVEQAVTIGNDAAGAEGNRLTPARVESRHFQDKVCPRPRGRSDRPPKCPNLSPLP